MGAAQLDLAHRVPDPRLGDDEVAAAQDGRGHQEPPHRVGSVAVDADGRVRDYKLRQPDQKRAAVNALKSLNYRVIAAGDSYNDTGMLMAADAGFFIHAPPAIAAQFPQFPVTHSYAELTAAIEASAAV